jgi:hypothetical protein
MWQKMQNWRLAEQHKSNNLLHIKVNDANQVNFATRKIFSTVSGCELLLACKDFVLPTEPPAILLAKRFRCQINFAK